MRSLEEWRRVVEAIEDTIPLYEAVNRFISLGLADATRKIAVTHSELRNGMIILDAGVGPGSLSALILESANPKLLVGLDFSLELLKVARRKLLAFERVYVEMVRAVFEFMPFRNGVFDRILTSYALRDSFDIQAALDEYSRVCRTGGRFVVVDIGKPDNPVKRWAATFYIHLVMPIIAKIVIARFMRGNPWRMIIPTFDKLPTNGQLTTKISAAFGKTVLLRFLFDGMIVVSADKTDPPLKSGILGFESLEIDGFPQARRGRWQ